MTQEDQIQNLELGTVEGESKWYHKVFQGSVHLKRQAVSLNLTLVDLAFSCTKSYPGQVNRHSLPFQVEAVLKYLVVPLTFALDCTHLSISKTHLRPISQSQKFL